MSGFVIDSSVWLEFFGGGKIARTSRKYIFSHQPLVTPTLILYEVYKKILQEKTEPSAILAVTQIENRSAAIIPLDEELSLFAADTSLKWKLAMADAIIYATVLQEEATLITHDHHFEGMENTILI